jgi:hypothetical protein
VKPRKRHGLRTPKIRKPRAKVSTGQPKNRRQAISENQITQALSLYSGTAHLGYLLPQGGRFVAFDIAGNQADAIARAARGAP